MFSVSKETSKFDKYVLPRSSDACTQPNEGTVVSIDKRGNPVSYFEDSVWDFNSFFSLSNEVAALYRITFHPEKHNPKLLIELKQRAYFLICGAKKELLTLEGDTFRKITHVIDCVGKVDLSLRLFRGTDINSFALLGNELVFSQLLHSLREYSVETVKKRLHSLSVLTQTNQYFPDQYHYSLSLPEGKSINQIAKQYASSGKGHYPTVIPAIYEQLMGRLIADVNAAYENLDDLDDVKIYAAKHRLTERQALLEFKMIRGACFVACSAFTGMRVSELASMDSDSYKETDLDGITLCTLRSWTKKLEVLPREDTWACSPICKKALGVLVKINDKYRSNKGDIYCEPKFGFSGDDINRQLNCKNLNKASFSLIFHDYSRHINISYVPAEMNEVYQLLNSYVPKAYNPIQKREDGSLYWRLSPHSLRRSLAHFVIGNGLVSLAALKHQFKHISLAMTAIYASHSDVLTLLGIENPANVKKDIENAEVDSHRAYLHDMLDNPEDQSGGYIKAFEGDPKVLTEEQFRELEKKTRGANKSTGYGRCFAGFKCKMEHLFEPSSCVGRDCENLNINRREASRWQDRHKRIGLKIQQMKDMGFYNQNTLARELTDIRTAEKVMRDHNIEFERFNLGDL